MNIDHINNFLNLNAEANKYTTHGKYELKLLDQETIEVSYIGGSRGFYAELTLAARGMLAFYNLYYSGFEQFKLSVNCSKAWSDFTPPGVLDLYPILYKRDLAVEFIRYPNLQSVLKDNGASNRIYRDLDFRQLNNLYSHHFCMSDEQQKYYDELVNKYKLDYENLIGVWYRGTDKGTELTLADPLEYVRLSEQILSQNSKLKILIQSDQQQVVELFKTTFKDRCFSFEEMPTTTGTKGYHKIIKNEDKVQFMKTLDICTRILSKCNFLINHTGNGGFVAQVHRNHKNNMWQFDRAGTLIGPVVI